MLSIVLSTFAFFVASYFIKRYLEDMGIPKGMTRSMLVFCLAAAISYGVGAFVSWVQPDSAPPGPGLVLPGIGHPGLEPGTINPPGHG